MLGGKLLTNQEKPENEREILHQKELKKNPTGNFTDHLNRAQSGMPNTSGMSSKELGWVILFFVLLFLGYGLYKMFLS